jgi:hypothetical protein
VVHLDGACLNTTTHNVTLPGSVVIGNSSTVISGGGGRVECNGTARSMVQRLMAAAGPSSSLPTRAPPSAAAGWLCTFSSNFPPRPEDDLARSLDCKITLNERLAFATIRETTDLIRSKSITPLDLVRYTTPTSISGYIYRN